MSDKKTVLCVRCRRPIESIDDLSVRGLSCSIHPFHKACYEQSKSRWIYALSMNMIGPGFWVYLAVMNAVLLSCLLVFPNSWTDLRWLFLVLNLPQIFFRVLAFVEYELPLSD